MVIILIGLAVLLFVGILAMNNSAKPRASTRHHGAKAQARGMFAASVQETEGHAYTLAGSDWCDFEVVGESFHQENLDRLAGGRSEDGASHRCVAILHPEDDNPYDANAVQVLIGGLPVAHLSREDAADYRCRMAELGRAGQQATCRAYINGGWLRDGETGAFGVKLGLNWPIELES